MDKAPNLESWKRELCKLLKLIQLPLFCGLLEILTQQKWSLLDVFAYEIESDLK
jgi:hypothetical protein